LRILQISHDYEGPFRAVCRQYNCAFRNHEVTTVYLCGAWDPDIVDATGGDRVIFLERSAASLRGVKLGALLAMARLFREERYDVVIAHRYKPIYIAGVLSRFFPIRLLLGVAHEHDVFKRISRRLFVTFWCRNIVCVGVSESVSANIEKYCGPLRDQGRLFTLPHAVDPSMAGMIHERAESREFLNITPGTFCFGTIGRLVTKKEHEVLLSAFSMFCHEAPDADATLIVMGTGPEGERLLKKCRELGIDERVSFAGHVDQAYKYLRALDVFVFSSGPREAFGMVLLEAMLAGLPIVSSDAPGPKEVVEEAGLSFAAGDAADLARQLLAIYRMPPDERDRLGALGRRRFEERFTLDAFERRVWQLPPVGALPRETR